MEASDRLKKSFWSFGGGVIQSIGAIESHSAAFSNLHHCQPAPCLGKTLIDNVVASTKVYLDNS